MLAGIPQKRVKCISRDNSSIQVLAVCEYMAGSAVCAVCPVSTFCVLAVSGGCHSQTVYLSNC